jgi:hypothetical protein
MSSFFRGGENKLISEIIKFRNDPAGNYNTEIGDLIPHGIAAITNIRLFIYDPRYDFPLHYGLESSQAVVVIAFNGRTDAAAHYDAVRPMPRASMSSRLAGRSDLHFTTVACGLQLDSVDHDGKSVGRAVMKSAAIKGVPISIDGEVIGSPTTLLMKAAHYLFARAVCRGFTKKMKICLNILNIVLNMIFV